MQKNISIRRSAQKLAKNGQLDKAVAAYKPLLASGSADPYDHLYVGDLYVKMRQDSEAITHYEAAIDEYQRLGFHRNGVALCRKILRIDGARYSTYRRLGDLYLAEELLGDALNSFATFLRNLPSDERDSDAFRDVVTCLVTHVPNRVDMAIQLSEVLKEVNRDQDALEILLQSFEAANKADDKPLSKILKSAILEINPAFSETMEAIQESGGGDVLDPCNINDLNIDEAIAEAGDEVAGGADGSDSVSGGGAGSAGSAGSAAFDSSAIETDLNLMLEEEETRVVKEETSEISISTRMEIDLETIDASREMATDSDSTSHAGADLESFGEVDIESQSEPDSAVAEASKSDSETFLASESQSDSETESQSDSDSESDVVPSGAGFGEIDLSDALDETPQWHADVGPAGNLANPKQAAEAAIEAEQWTSALNRTEEWLQIEPKSKEALDCLIQICRALEDYDRLVKGLTQKGDLLIVEQEYEKAAPLFNEAIRIQPDNDIARRRVARFAEMGLLDEAATAADAAAGDAAAGDAASTRADEAAGDADSVGSADNADGAASETEEAEKVYEISALDEVEETPVLDESEEMAVPRVLADKNALVSVQDESPAREDGEQQEWMEIGALLEEFKAGVKDLVDKEDFQAHYDLAISHMEMELFEEALEEFDTAISSSDCPQHMLIRFKELRGKCYSNLARHREAIFEFRDALTQPEVSVQEMPGLKLLLAKELTAVGDVDEARICLEETIAERPDFKEALVYLESLDTGAA